VLGAFRHPYQGYRVSFPGVRQPGRGFDHPTPSSAEVKGVELYLFSSGPSWQGIGDLNVLLIWKKIIM